METPSSSLPPHVPTGNEKLWSILSHLSVLAGVGLLLPLAVYLAMRNESEFTEASAREALNFHLSLLIYSLCCIPLVFVVIGVPLLIILALGSLALAIIAAVKTSDGIVYRYPLTIRMIQ